MTSPESSPQQKPPAGVAPTLRGRFLWLELLVRDRDAALAFYPAVMGWTVQTMNVPGGTDVYTIFANGDAGLAGLTLYPAAQLAGGAPPRWLPYMGTDDAEATYRTAIKLGATAMMPPSRIATVGTIAMLQDPQGAVFALIQPEPAGRPETVPVAGEFAWYEMLADDPEASFEFYRQLFGWVSKQKMDMGKDGVYEMFGLGEFMYGGFMRRSAAQPAATWNCYVRVMDLDAAVEAITAKGGTIVRGPHEVPNNDRIVLAVDNQDAMFSLVSAIRK